MDQQTHSWIAIRAIALLEQEDKGSNLVKLLKPHARAASAGAWIPDQTDAKHGGSATENHILKMEPCKDIQDKRFVTSKKELLKHVGPHRLTFDFLQSDQTLNDQWWSTPYRGDVPKPGQHLPNRAMALSTMMKDLLLLGDDTIDKLVPGEIGFVKYLDTRVRTNEAAAAAYFFMTSHFVADASMPCHCDGRKLANYDHGLHKEWEKHWSVGVGQAFEKASLLKAQPGLTPEDDSDWVLQSAREIDSRFGLEFGSAAIPGLQPKHDVWLELVHLCRASFAVASIAAPYRDYPYDNSVEKAPFDSIFGSGREGLLKELDRAILHDAVLNTAIIWKHVWTCLSS